MAPIPPVLLRIAMQMVSQHLARRLAASPVFQSAVHRLLHEVDHLPTRINGGKVPEYRHPDPLHKSVADHAREAREGDPGEPHDEPSPFPMSSRPSSSPPPSASRSRRDDGGGTGLRDSRGSLRPRTPRDEAWQKAQAAEKQKDEARLEDFQGREREMSEILRLLREKKEREGSGQ